MTERARAAGIEPPLDCAHHNVRRGRAPRGHAGVPTRHLYCFGTDRERAIGLYRAPPISIPSVAALVVVVPPEPLAAFLDQGGYLDGPLLGQRTSVGQAEPIWTFAKQFRCYSGASSKRELFRPAATSSLSFRPTLRGAPGGSISV